MDTHVLRRSALAMGLLGALLVAAGTVLVTVGVPVWVPLVSSLFMVALQWALSPLLIECLIPAQKMISSSSTGYRTDHVLGEIVARRCREAGVPLVRLGIVDDGTPTRSPSGTPVATPGSSSPGACWSASTRPSWTR